KKEENAQSLLQGGQALEQGAKEDSETKLDWQRQKQEQARLRKIANELKKVEDEIEKREERIAEIDEICQDPAVATNSAKLNELGSEREKCSQELENLYEQWEILSEDS
ncbi:MAG: ABC transporter C-terminal domain-containing protein, partial [Lachnospiraceae bacterium]